MSSVIQNIKGHLVCIELYKGQGTVPLQIAMFSFMMLHVWNQQVVAMVTINGQVHCSSLLGKEKQEFVKKALMESYKLL